MQHDDFKFEPVKRLPVELPEGEHILWQGRPSAWRLAREAVMPRYCHRLVYRADRLWSR